ncbi:MAG: hypothetical protein RR800_00565 [Comamonas sp.]
MFSVRNALLAIVPCLLVGAASASLVGFLAYAQLKTERAEHAAELASVRLGSAMSSLQDLVDLAETTRQVAVAVTDMQKEANDKATKLQAGIDGLRSDTAGLRRDYAELPQQFGRLTRSTIERYASTCTGLLGDLADEGAALSAEGAGIARSAQGHYIDDRAKTLSWPAPSRSALTPHKEKTQ